LRASLRNFGLKVGLVGTVKFEARIKERDSREFLRFVGQLLDQNAAAQAQPVPAPPMPPPMPPLAHVDQSPPGRAGVSAFALSSEKSGGTSNLPVCRSYLQRQSFTTPVCSGLRPLMLASPDRAITR